MGVRSGSVPGAIGRYNSSPGNMKLLQNANYADRIRAHSSLAYFWELYSFAPPATSAVGIVGNLQLTTYGTFTSISNTEAVPGEGAVQTTSNAYLRTTGQSAVSNSNGVVEFWCKITSNPATSSGQKGLLFGHVESSSKYTEVVYIDYQGNLNFAVQNSSGSVTEAKYTGFKLNRWNHVFAVHNYGSSFYIDLLVNGASNASSTLLFSSGRTDLATGTTYIGGTGGTFGFLNTPGYYNNVAIYNNSPLLTVDDAKAHFTSGSGYMIGASTRTTQAVAEVLRDTSGRKGRVSQLVTEVLRDSSTRKLRTTQLVVEVLRSSAVGTPPYVSNLAHTLTVSHSISQVRQKQLSLSHTITVSQSSTQVRQKPFVISQSIAVTQAFQKINSYRYFISQGVNVLQSLTTQGQRIYDLAQSVQVTQSLQKSLSFFLSFSHSVGVSDTSAVQYPFKYVLSDTILVSQTLAFVRPFNGRLFATIHVSDSWTYNQVRNFSFNDSIGVTQLFKQYKVNFQILGQSVSIAQAFVANKAKVFRFGHSIYVASTFVRTSGFKFDFVHSIRVDSKFRVGSNVTKSFTDTLVIDSGFHVSIRVNDRPDNTTYVNPVTGGVGGPNPDALTQVYQTGIDYVNPKMVTLSSLTGEIILPTPELGNSLTPKVETQARQAMSGLTYTYNKTNPTYKFTYNWILDLPKAFEFKYWLMANLGNSIRVVNHKGEIWDAKILTNEIPIKHKSAYAGPAREKVEVTIEFEGTKIYG